MKIGYARASSTGQSLDLQLDKLADCDKIFQERASGTGAARPALESCLEYVREGESLVVTRLDRLARSTLHLCQITAELERKKVCLYVLDQDIDTSEANGQMLFATLRIIGQFETEIRAERQADGIRKAKERGVAFGRKSALSTRAIRELRELRADGALIRELMDKYGLSKATIYRHLKTR